MRQVEVELLGGCAVRVDGAPVASDAWPQRRAADLVKVLALADGHRLARDEVLEALWPHLSPEAGAANLHKAASYARRALGDRKAIVIRGGMVELAPEATVSTDIDRVGEDGAGAELLPDDRYEAWTIAARERLRARRLELLLERGRWEDVLAEDPTDKSAHRALMRAHADAGDRAAAIRQFQQLEDELAGMGLRPSKATVELLAEIGRGPAVNAPLPAWHATVQAEAPGIGTAALAGSDAELRTARRSLDAAGAGQGGVLWISGDAGIGKTRLAEEVLAIAADRGWHTLRGATGEAPEPYEPVVDALDGLLSSGPTCSLVCSHRSRRRSRVSAPRARGRPSIRRARRAARRCSPRSPGSCAPPVASAAWSCCSTTCTPPTTPRCAPSSTWPAALAASGCWWW